MVSINKILDSEEISTPKVDESSRNLILSVRNNKVSIKIDPKETREFELTKDQAILCAHMLLARARLIEE